MEREPITPHNATQYDPWLRFPLYKMKATPSPKTNREGTPYPPVRYTQNNSASSVLGTDECTQLLIQYIMCFYVYVL